MRCAIYNVAACLFSILDEMFHEETWTFCPVAWEASCNGTGIREVRPWVITMGCHSTSCGHLVCTQAG